MTKKYEKDGFTIVINRVIDQDPDTSYLEQDYSDIGDAAEAAKYRTQDKLRLASYYQGDWYFMGITASVRKQTSSNWADGGLEVGRASIWGVESDSSEEYLESVEKDMEQEALLEVERLKVALGLIVA